MKLPAISLFFALASAGTLSASVTISALVHIPNGQAAGGVAPAGVGALNTTPAYTITSDRGLPATTYSVSNVDLTSVGGTATESFTYTVTYSQTGGTDLVYTGFGNVGISGGSDLNINGAEILTVTVALGTSSFPNLSLTGFTQARAGGFASGETGTFTHGGGTTGVAFGDTIKTISGSSFDFSVASGSALSLEGYTVGFLAVPEPASASLLAFGAVALLRRRRK
jgi:hypothetical protein